MHIFETHLEKNDFVTTSYPIFVVQVTETLESFNTNLQNTSEHIPLCSYGLFVL